MNTIEVLLKSESAPALGWFIVKGK